MRPTVTNRVAWSICKSVAVVSPAKMAQMIEMQFGLRTRVGNKSPHGKGQFCGEKGQPIVKYRDTLW